MGLCPLPHLGAYCIAVTLYISQASSRCCAGSNAVGYRWPGVHLRYVAFRAALRVQVRSVAVRHKFMALYDRLRARQATAEAFYMWWAVAAVAKVRTCSWHLVRGGSWLPLLQL